MSTVRIQVRRGTASQWTSVNPILAAGEMGVESDTNLFKFGNGSSTWTALVYANNSDVAIGEISQDAIDTALTMGAGLTKTYSDGANTITINVDSTVVALKSYVDTGVATAASDATTKVAAEAALRVSGDSASVSTAAADATTKANAAQAAAIAAAAAALSSLSNTVDSDFVPVSDLGQPNGVATLNASTKVPTSQIDTDVIALKTYVQSQDTAAILTANTYTDGQVANLVGGAPATLNTLNELSTALAADANFSTTITNSIGLKAPLASPTFTGTVTIPSGASISGFALLESPIFSGTVSLPSGTSIGSVGSAEIGYLDGVTSTLQGQIDAKAPAAAPTFTGSVTLPSTTSIGEVSNVEIAYVNGATSNLQQQLDAKAPLANAVFTGTFEAPVATITGAMLVNGTVTSSQIADGTIATGDLADSAVTSAKIADGTIVDGDIHASAGIATSKVAGLDTALGLLAPLAAPTFTGTVVLPSTTSIGLVDSTEIGYVNGVTSSIQTQIDLKAPLASPTFTGTVSGITKSMVGLGSADDTADTAKPVSTATQTALDLKSPLASPTFTGTVTTGHVLPATDVTFDLGSPAKMWRDIYVGPGSLYVNGQKVLQTDAGDVVITADANENLALRTSGSGNIELDPTGAGTVSIKGPMVIEASANITSADGNGINFASAIKVDAITSKTLDTDLSLSGNGTGKVYLNDNAEVNGNLVVGGNLTVSGTTTTVNSETISLADNIIDLNSNFTTGTPTENAGIKIKRGDSSDVQMRWNESTDKWDFTNDGTNYSSVAGLESPTFTGTVSGVTKTMVGLGNADNTSDASKPVSTATQTALDAKLASATAATTYAPIASPTFTGTVTVAAAGVAFTDGTQTKAGIPSLTTIGTEISAAYNLSTGGLSLRDQLVPVAGTRAITIPTNATTAFPIGTSIDFYQASGTGANFVAADGTVTILRTPGLTLRTTHSSATLTKVAINTWLLAGDLTA